MMTGAAAGTSAAVCACARPTGKIIETRGREKLIARRSRSLTPTEIFPPLWPSQLAVRWGGGLAFDCARNQRAVGRFCAAVRRDGGRRLTGHCSCTVKQWPTQRVRTHRFGCGCSTLRGIRTFVLEEKEMGDDPEQQDSASIEWPNVIEGPLLDLDTFLDFYDKREAKGEALPPRLVDDLTDILLRKYGVKSKTTLITQAVMYKDGKLVSAPEEVQLVSPGDNGVSIVVPPGVVRLKGELLTVDRITELMKSHATVFPGLPWLPGPRLPVAARLMIESPGFGKVGPFQGRLDRVRLLDEFFQKYGLNPDDPQWQNFEFDQLVALGRMSKELEQKLGFAISIFPPRKTGRNPLEAYDIGEKLIQGGLSHTAAFTELVSTGVIIISGRSEFERLSQYDDMQSKFVEAMKKRAQRRKKS